MGIFNSKKEEVVESGQEVAIEKILENKGIDLGENKNEVLQLLDFMKILESWHMVVFGILSQYPMIVKKKDSANNSEVLPFFSYYLQLDEAVLVGDFEDQFKAFLNCYDFIKNLPENLTAEQVEKYHALNEIYELIYNSRADYSIEPLFDPLCSEDFLKAIFLVHVFPELFDDLTKKLAKGSMDLVYFLSHGIKFITIARE